MPTDHTYFFSELKPETYIFFFFFFFFFALAPCMRWDQSFCDAEKGVTVKIGDAENRCRGIRDKNRWKRPKIPVRLILYRVPYGAKRMPKQKNISNSNSISFLSIPSTDSPHNGKCNICAFHEEIHAFEAWIFVRLSSLVLASECTTIRNKFIV